MIGKIRSPDARSFGSGRLLPGRGRTFADFLRPPAEVAAPVALFDYPHRREIEARLGRPFSLRARVDAAACAARGALAFLDGEGACFSTASPDLADALRLALAALGG